MKALKILLVIVALVAISGMTDTWAQCSGGSRQFSSSGASGKNVRATQTGVHNNQTAIGRFWDSDDWTQSHNGVFNDVETGAGSECFEQELGCLCPSTDPDPLRAWWVPHGSSGNEQKITGWASQAPCLQLGCPSKMTVVVEDYAAAGPPGIGDTAYYIGWMVDETGEARWWDFARVDGLNTSTTFPMLPFPDLVITGSSRIGTTAVQIVYNNLDQTNNVHTYDNINGAVFPTADVISEWQIVKFTGSDPGRARSLGWNTIATTTYVQGGTTGAVLTVPCDNQVDDEWVAVGIGFNGGTGVIDSALVGRAIALECDPNLADPQDVDVPTDRKPATQEIQARPGRSGGRR